MGSLQRASGRFLALCAIATLSACGPTPSAKAVDEDATAYAPPPSADASQASDAQLQKANAEAIAGTEKTTLPAGAPEAPVSALCTTTSCATQVAVFARKDWPLAWRGDYQGQRNAAFCRVNSCDGAVQPNLVEGCAWRMIILAGNALKSDDTDASNLKIDCGKLGAAERSAAVLKAEAMHQQIYHRPM